MDRPIAIWRVTSFEQVQDAIKVILRELNGGHRGDIAQAIHETVSREHRTLQESFWSAILLAQIAYADNGHDARNEAAVELAKAVRELAIERNIDRGLPYV